MHLAGDADALILPHVLQINGEGAQLLMRLAEIVLRAPAFSSFDGFPQGPLHGGGKTTESVFQNVISRSTFEHFDHHFFSEGAGDENKWDIGILFLDDLQGAQAVKTWQ